MTCIDPALDLAFPLADSDRKITLLKQAFDYHNMDLAPYDLVIGQKPCEATEHIVRACMGQDKPFILALCGTPHKYLSGQMPETVYAWYDYLAELSGDYAVLLYLPLYNGYKTAVLLSKAPFLS